MANEKKGQEGSQQDENEMIRVRHEKLETFRKRGVHPFGHRFEVTDYAVPVKEAYDHLAEDAEGGEVKIAGRLMVLQRFAIRRATFKFTLSSTYSVKKSIRKSLESSTSVTSSASTVRSLRRAAVRSPSASIILTCSQRLFALCRRNFTVYRMSICAIVSAILT